MATKIAVLSDTHGLLRPEVLDRIAGCDVIIHGGDINKPEIIDRLKEIAPVYVVRGNNDKEWAENIPESLTFQIEKSRFFVVHNKKFVAKDLYDADVVIYYKSGKPAADKLKSIRFEKSRQKYKSEHDNELRTFYMAERKLKPYFKDGKLPITAWRREQEQLEQEYRDIQSELSPLLADAKKLWAIHYNIYEVQHEQERRNAATRQKRQEIER